MRHLQITTHDNVAVALCDLTAGESIGNVCLREPIPNGHKFALQPLPKGSLIIKYGLPIGSASKDIQPGEHVHVHNLVTGLDDVIEYTYTAATATPSLATPPAEATFLGYRRPDGQVGIRNHLYIIPTVGCVNKLAEQLARDFNQEQRFPHIDRAIALTHPYGCSQLGDDHQMTRTILAAHASQPNAAAVLILGLGCENNTVETFQQILTPEMLGRRKIIVAQEETDDFAAGRQALCELALACASDRRQAIPASELIVGLKCGGSDGFSGITANPLLGRFADRLAALNGTTLLTEVPEMFGAETLLMQRCISREVFDKCVNMINDFKQYYRQHGQVIYENPSPGNKEGGITTLEEKSLGCTQKGGSGMVVDVLQNGEKPRQRGLNLLYGPGNDMVATTMLSAAGAHLVLFTTGRGTPFGGVVPTLKIASNTDLTKRKQQWIDFDAGKMLLSQTNQTQLDQQFFQLVLEVASGKPAQNELHGYEEIAIFKNGVTL